MSAPSSGHGRMVHVVAALLGFGGLAFALTVLPLVAQQRAVLAPWWTPTAATTLLGGLLVLGVLGVLPGVPDRAVRAAAGTWSALLLLAVASVPQVLRGVAPDGDAPWLSGFLGVGVAAGALAWPRAVAVANLLAVSGMWGVARWHGTGRSDALVSTQDAVYAAAMGLMLMAVVWLVVDAARAVDRVTAADAERVVAEARSRSRAAERDRLAGVVHDGVLSALLAATGGTAPRAAVALEARRALDDLEELRLPVNPSGEVDGADLVQRLEVRATAAGAAASVVADVAPARLPERVAGKLVSAAAEALRNSVRHAGADATRDVTVTVRPGWVEVRVRDNGTGFDPDAVPAGRLGLRGSVEGRMSRLPGGYARVRSRPGAGTEVVVGWRA